MKKQLIRKGVWETNSSSSHSLSLATEDMDFVLDTLYPDGDGRIFLHGGDFGWEWEAINDAKTKANYAAQDLGDSSVLRQVIIDQTGATEVIIAPDGYIDHESSGTAPSSYEDLKNFIFNKNSYLFTGNDNSSPTPTFFDVPIIKNGRVEKIEYTHELTIEGLDLSTKFKSEPNEETLVDAFSSLLSGHVIINGVLLDEQKMDIMSRISEHGNRFMFDSFEYPPNMEKKEVYFIDSNRKFGVESLYLKYVKDLDWKSRKEFLRRSIMNDHPDLIKTYKFNIKKIK